MYRIPAVSYTTDEYKIGVKDTMYFCNNEIFYSKYVAPAGICNILSTIAFFSEPKRQAKKDRPEDRRQEFRPEKSIFAGGSFPGTARFRHDRATEHKGKRSEASVRRPTGNGGSAVRPHACIMIAQKEFTLAPRPQGFHLITEEVLRHLPPLPRTGLLHLFIRHTSAALSLNENADPDVRTDLESVFDRLVPEREPYYNHTLEGDDDMPAHAKSTLAGASLTIPVTRGRLGLGTWQGIYLCEFRRHGGPRRIVATVMGE